jgi:hypothetical protein
MRITLKQNLTTFEEVFNDLLTSCKAKGLAEKTNHL